MQVLSLYLIKNLLKTSFVEQSIETTWKSVNSILHLICIQQQKRFICLIC